MDSPTEKDTAFKRHTLKLVSVSRIRASAPDLYAALEAFEAWQQSLDDYSYWSGVQDVSEDERRANLARLYQESDDAEERCKRLAEDALAKARGEPLPSEVWSS